MALTLVLVALVLFALFLGGSLVAQGYLYQQPADNLAVRALGAAVLVASFITLWVAIDRRVPRKYDTFFEFAPYQTRDFAEFEALRWTATLKRSDDSKRQVLEVNKDSSGNPVEVSIKYKRGVGAKSNMFFEEGTESAFKPMGTDTKTGQSFMVAAIKVKAEPDAEPVRFKALLKEPKGSEPPIYAVDPPKFVEEKGSRYVQGDQLGVVYVPSTTTVILAILLNLLHFAIWFVAFWLILQFSRGHAFALTVLFGLVTMLLVMPLLFKPGRTPKAPEAPAGQKAEREGTGVRGQGSAGGSRANASAMGC